MREFHSFQEIDQQLRFLSLKRDITRERLAYRWNVFQAGLHPSHIVGQWQKKIQKPLFFLLTSILLRKLRRDKNQES